MSILLCSIPSQAICLAFFVGTFAKSYLDMCKIMLTKEPVLLKRCLVLAPTVSMPLIFLLPAQPGGFLIPLAGIVAASLGLIYSCGKINQLKPEDSPSTFSYKLAVPVLSCCCFFSSVALIASNFLYGSPTKSVTALTYFLAFVAVLKLTDKFKSNPRL